MSYFKTDCLPVAQEARHSDAVFIDVATMVLLSIQQPWQGVPAQFANVKRRGRDSVYLFGAKRGGFDYVVEHASSLRIAANIAYDNGDLDALLMRYLDVPGLGLVKASFLAQLTIANGACLDLHNARRLGLGDRALLLNKKLTNKTKLARISAYNALWAQHGTSEYWWNTWCDNMVGTTMNRSFTTGAQVSAVHRLPIQGLEFDAMEG
jgi:hypothetical protein